VHRKKPVKNGRNIGKRVKRVIASNVIKHLSTIFRLYKREEFVNLNEYRSNESICSKRC
jgi:hypothetical protein